MDKTLKSKWVRALRSGRYQQAAGALLSYEGAYCCLGVLAKIQGCDLGAIRANAEDDVITDDLPRGLNAGLKKQTRGRLASMNDAGKSFKEIADYIEKRL